MAENRFENMFAEADAAFDGKYSKELNKLLGLSRKEIDKIIPGTNDLKIYNKLIEIVKKASKDNLSQAQLVEDIKVLGEIGIKIANKIPELAKLL